MWGPVAAPGCSVVGGLRWLRAVPRLGSDCSGASVEAVTGHGSVACRRVWRGRPSHPVDRSVSAAAGWGSCFHAGAAMYHGSLRAPLDLSLVGGSLTGRCRDFGEPDGVERTLTLVGTYERVGGSDRLRRNSNVNPIVTSRVVPCVSVDDSSVGRSSRGGRDVKTVTDRSYDVPCDCGAAA